MASKYRTRYKESGFKSRSFGDLGISSYKAQQEQIIDGLRIQSDQFEKVQTDALKAEESKARKEIEWDNYLKELEDSRTRIKRGAISTRQETEVSALEGKAAEYGRKADFFASVAPKYAQSLMDIGTGLAKKAKAKKIQDAEIEMAANPVWDAYREGMVINDGNMIKYMSENPTSDNIKEGLTLLNRNSNQIAASNYMLKHMDESFNSFIGKSLNKEQGSPTFGESTYTDGSYTDYVKVLLRSQNIKLTSPEGRNVILEAVKKEQDYRIAQTKEAKYLAAEDISKKVLAKYTNKFNDGSTIDTGERTNVLHEAILNEGIRIEKVDGKYIQRGFYTKDASGKRVCNHQKCLSIRDATMEFLRTRVNDADFDQYYNWDDFYNQHNLGVIQNGTAKEGELIMNKLSDADIQELKDEWIKRSKKNLSNKQHEDKRSDKAKAADVLAKIKDGTYDPDDLTPGGSRDLMFKAMQKEAIGSLTRKAYAQVLNIDPKATNTIYVLDQLERSIISNDIPSFYNYYYLLDKKDRQSYTANFEFFQKFERVLGNDPNLIENVIKGYLPDKKEVVVDEFDTSYDDIVRLGTIRFMTLFMAEKSEDFRERFENVRKTIKDEVNFKLDRDKNNNKQGFGIFRSDLDKGQNKRRYLTVLSEDTHNIAKPAKIKQLISINQEGAKADFKPNSPKNFYKEMERNGQPVVLQDEFDRALSNATVGVAPISNERIDAIVEARRKTDVEITVRKVWNELFATYGFDVVIPPGPEEWNFWTMRYSKLMCSNYSQLSRRNQTAVSLVGENYDGKQCPQRNNLNTQPSQDFKEALREFKFKVDKYGVGAIDMSKVSDQVFQYKSRLY